MEKMLRYKILVILSLHPLCYSQVMIRNVPPVTEAFPQRCSVRKTVLGNFANSQISHKVAGLRYGTSFKLHFLDTFTYRTPSVVASSVTFNSQKDRSKIVK